MNKLLKGLKLREPTGGIVEPFEFDAHTIERLARWFDSNSVARLRGFVEIAKQLERDNAEEPTVGDAREVMMRIKELAAALSTALSQAPSTVQAELDLFSQKSFGDWRKAEMMAGDLETLAAAMEQQTASLPLQGRRASHSFLVSGIAEVAEPAGITVSESEHAQFTMICKCVFEAAGIFQDPRGSIRAYMAARA